MIDRSKGPGIIYSFPMIPSVLLGAQIHGQIYPPMVLLTVGAVEVNQDRKIQSTELGLKLTTFGLPVEPLNHPGSPPDKCIKATVWHFSLTVG